MKNEKWQQKCEKLNSHQTGRWETSISQELIRLPENLTKETAKHLVEFALWKGFFAVSAVFPVVSRKEGVKVPDCLSFCQNVMPIEERPDFYEAASNHAFPIPDLDWRKKKGLESIFAKGIFLKDTNHDLLPDALDCRIVLPEEVDESIVIAAANLAYRLGMETTAYEGAVVAENGYKGNAFVLERGSEQESCRMWLEEKEGYTLAHICGCGKQLEEFSAWICEKFPLLSGGQTWSDRLMELTDSFAMKNLNGQLSFLKMLQKKTGAKEPYNAYVSPEISHVRTKAQEEFPQVTFENYKGRKRVYEKTYELQWEVDLCRKVLEKEVYQKLKEGDSVTVAVAVSEDRKVREKLAEEIKRKVKEHGAHLKELSVLCAYKQGFSWMEEDILPRLRQAEADGKKTVSLEISFRPFLPEGEHVWLDENGATPSYANLSGNDPEKWYDLPIRYLQELYPVLDVIERQLGIAKEQIAFSTYEGVRDCTYFVTAKDQEGNTILEDSYLAACSERPYLDAYPDMGKVHPATGYVRVSIGGEALRETKIATDLERIWEIYQGEVLLDLKTFLEGKYGEKICASQQPFFSRLSLEIEASEPDERLESREDLFSSLDAFHEDLYFVGTDFFKNYGMRQCGEMFDAPGLILPILKKKEGPPKFRVTLDDVMAEGPVILTKDGAVAANQKKREAFALYIKEISYNKGEIIVSIETGKENAKIAEAYADLFERGVLYGDQLYGGAGQVVFCAGEQNIRMQVPKWEEPVKDMEISEIDLSEHSLIGYDRYLEIIEQLKKVSNLSVCRTAVSYEGREIYAVELIPEDPGYLSRVKRINAFPSEIINARHHANEVSGTNAAFILLKQLLTDPKYRKLPEKMNLAVVPMENVDGTALHYELQKEHPYWKFHVARFNAIGKEFYHEHFKEDTIHTEAMGMTRLWYRMLPDIVVDNHGVPSHEWEQQFSGYTSPSYKGFWLPRSLLYGYFWYVTDKEYRSNYAVNKKMEDVIADAIGAQKDISGRNQEWMEQFEKFAHGWMPKLFPADYYKEMINYWIPFAADINHRYPSIRFPWITTVAYTSEVADETAQGAYLNLCAKAHVTHDLATIDMVLKGKSIFLSAQENEKDKVSICHIRQRPLLV